MEKVVRVIQALRVDEVEGEVAEAFLEEGLMCKRVEAPEVQC